MKFRLLSGIWTIGLILIIVIFYGCVESTTHTAIRIPPPPPAPAPPPPTPKPTPEPTPPPVVSVPNPEPIPTPIPTPSAKTKTPKKPQTTYVVLHTPVGILGASKIDILDNPTPKGNVISKVSSGTKLQLLSTQGSWMKVKTPDGRTGWISTSYIAK